MAELFRILANEVPAGECQRADFGENVFPIDRLEIFLLVAVGAGVESNLTFDDTLTLASPCRDSNRQEFIAARTLHTQAYPAVPVSGEPIRKKPRFSCPRCRGRWRKSRGS